jgi:hypothetical protein
VKKKFLVAILKDTDEITRSVRDTDPGTRISTKMSRIRGPGSVPKCHGIRIRNTGINTIYRNLSTSNFFTMNILLRFFYEFWRSYV